MPVGIFTDFDSHGLSIASYVSNKVRRKEGPLCAPAVVSPKAGIRSLFPAAVSALSVAHKTACSTKARLIIADFPAQLPISTLLLPLINDRNEEIFFVDHHPYFTNILHKMKEKGITPVIATGAGMSVNLSRLSELEDEERLIVGLRDPVALQTIKFIELLYEDMDAKLLLYGLLADSDWSGAKTFMDLGLGDEDDVIKYALSLDADFRALGYSIIGMNPAEAISYFRDPDEVWRKTPFFKFSKKINKFKEEEVLGGRAVVLSRPDIPKSYTDKAIAVYMWENGYEYAIIKKDDENGKRVTVAAKWWDGRLRDIFSELFKNIISDNSNYTIHGSQTLATITPSSYKRRNELDFDEITEKVIDTLDSVWPI